jgi:hypothetical protein
MIGSTWAACAAYETPNTTVITKAKSVVGSLRTVRKNHLAMSGTPHAIAAMYTASEPSSDSQNVGPMLPLAPLAAMASTRSARISVRIVPPRVVVTARFFTIPSRLATGYASTVCEAKTEPSRREDQSP